MTDHAAKAADHAEHAGAHLGAAKTEAESAGGFGTSSHLKAAHVEAMLSVGQRLADISARLETAVDRLGAIGGLIETSMTPRR